MRVKGKMAEDSKPESHNPAEIFGFPPSNRSKEAEEVRNAGKCPFTGEKCTKESRLLNTPFGVCSVWHGGTPRIICPNRFLFGGNALLKQVTSHFLNENQIQFVKEVPLSHRKGEKRIDYGRVDWVAYKTEENEVEGIKDFCGIEIMADATTQTGELVRAFNDFLNGNLSNRYNYGLNTYNTIKLSFTQILNKGQVFEHWQKYYIWMLQDVLFSNFTRRFNLQISEIPSRKSEKGEKYIIFATVAMKKSEKANFYELRLDKLYHASIDELLRAYHRIDIPPIEYFIDAIKHKSSDNF